MMISDELGKVTEWVPINIIWEIGFGRQFYFE